MTDNGDYYYFLSRKLKAKFLRLPYAGKSYSMYVVLPTEENNIDALLQSLDSKTLHQEAWYMDEYKVDVKLPKFKVNYPVNLKPYFQEVRRRGATLCKVNKLDTILETFTDGHQLDL